MSELANSTANKNRIKTSRQAVANFEGPLQMCCNCRRRKSKPSRADLPRCFQGLFWPRWRRKLRRGEIGERSTGSPVSGNPEALASPLTGALFWWELLVSAYNFARETAGNESIGIQEAIEFALRSTRSRDGTGLPIDRSTVNTAAHDDIRPS